MPGETCVANIGPRERRRRLAAAGVLGVAGLAVLGALIAAGADRWWRLALFPFFWGGAACLFQWRDRT